MYIESDRGLRFHIARPISETSRRANPIHSESGSNQPPKKKKHHVLIVPELKVRTQNHGFTRHAPRGFRRSHSHPPSVRLHIKISSPPESIAIPRNHPSHIQLLHPNSHSQAQRDKKKIKQQQQKLAARQGDQEKWQRRRGASSRATAPGSRRRATCWAGTWKRQRQRRRRRRWSSRGRCQAR